jgi:hypothetical protein
MGYELVCGNQELRARRRACGDEDNRREAQGEAKRPCDPRLRRIQQAVSAIFSHVFLWKIGYREQEHVRWTPGMTFS